MRANLRYAAAADNSAVDQAPGFRDLQFNGDYSYVHATEPDGSYRIPVLPGRGLLAVELWEPGYYPVDDPGRIRPEQSRFVPYLYGYDSFATEIEAQADTDLVHDFTLDVGRSRTILGEIVDPKEGRSRAQAFPASTNSTPGNRRQSRASSRSPSFTAGLRGPCRGCSRSGASTGAGVVCRPRGCAGGRLCQSDPASGRLHGR